MLDAPNKKPRIKPEAAPERHAAPAPQRQTTSQGGGAPGEGPRGSTHPAHDFPTRNTNPSQKSQAQVTRWGHVVGTSEPSRVVYDMPGRPLNRAGQAEGEMGPYPDYASLVMPAPLSVSDGALDAGSSLASAKNLSTNQDYLLTGGMGGHTPHYPHSSSVAGEGGFVNPDAVSGAADIREAALRALLKTFNRG